MEQEKNLQDYDFKIIPATEEGFNLDTCFEGQYKQNDMYEKDADYYFDSYSHFGIHEEMLKDRVRTQAYQNAITKNKHLFEGKIVMDIGCGTGILSIFAAQAGAKQVYAIENAGIATHAKNIIQMNGYGDRITVIRGKMEEITLPVEKVDIIISEWMGYFLLYESMLDTILFARDKYLVEGGLLFPDKAAMFMASIEDEEYKNEKINFWDSVYGVNMSNIKKWALMEPIVDPVDRKTINSENCPIFSIDLNTVKKSDLDFTAGYSLKIQRNDYVHAVVVWFEVYFTPCHVPVKISTSPYNRETHWKQTVFYLQDVLPVKKGDILSGSIAVKKNTKNERELDIKISYNLENKVKSYHVQQYYRLS